jgi:hypothetical protein
MGAMPLIWAATIETALSPVIELHFNDENETRKVQ